MEEIKNNENEIIVINKDNISDVMELANNYKFYTEKISSSIKEIANNYIHLGYYFKRVKDDNVFKGNGYSNIYDYAEDNFNIKETTVKNLIKINELFCEDNNLKIEYKDYSYSQLVELSASDEKDLSNFNSEMSVREIKKFKLEAKLKEKAVEFFNEYLEKIDEIVKYTQSLELSNKYTIKKVKNNLNSNFSEVESNYYFDLVSDKKDNPSIKILYNFDYEMNYKICIFRMYKGTVANWNYGLNINLDLDIDNKIKSDIKQQINKYISDEIKIIKESKQKNENKVIFENKYYSLNELLELNVADYVIKNFKKYKDIFNFSDDDKFIYFKNEGTSFIYYSNLFISAGYNNSISIYDYDKNKQINYKCTFSSDYVFKFLESKNISFKDYINFIINEYSKEQESKNSEEDNDAEEGGNIEVEE